jgi:hypothetical protein
MNKTFFFFLVLFFIIFTLGCGAFNKTGGSLDASATSQISKGNLNSTILVNGKEKTSFDLLGEQTAIVVVNIKNIDTKEMRNLELRVYGLNVTPKLQTPVEVMYPDSTESFQWTVRAPKLGESERLTVPLIIRACYEQTVSGRTDIVVIPKDEEVGDFGTTFTDISGAVKLEFNTAPIALVGEGNSGHSRTDVYVRNVGAGWVDYFNYSKDNLSVSKLKEVNLQLITSSNALKIKTFNDFDATKLIVNGDSSGKITQTITIKSSDTNFDLDNTGVEKSYPYFLKLVNGKELNLRLGMEVLDGSDYEQTTSELLKVNATYGYCLDLATLNVNMRGR